MNAYRANRVLAEQPATGNNNLELIDEMEVRRDHGAGFLLDQKRLGLAHLERLGIDIFGRFGVDQLFGLSRRWWANELGTPHHLSILRDARKAGSQSLGLCNRKHR